MKPKEMSWMRGALVAVGLVLSLGFLPVLRADDGDQGSPQGRAVRLSSVDGQVEVIAGGQVLTDRAIANTPLFEGTQLITGNDGRAEMQFEDGSVARIPPASSLTLTVLRPGGDTEILLGSGMGYFELQDHGQSPQMRLRFGPEVVTASGFTVLRVKLDEGPPNVAVFSGNAHLEGAGGSVDLHGGESIALSNPNPADSAVAESIEPDSWDGWNSDRDQALTASESAPGNPNVPEGNNPAWGDLNSNGTWYDVPGQGEIWSPYEASNSGWDPYGTGYWMWTPGYGYVWVSGEAWGYMPYQCGAWNYYDAFGWGWAPGGCSPWWGGGYPGAGGGVWIFTVGTTPTWYKLPVRPGPPRPRNPHPTIRARAVGPEPVIPVHRTLPVQGTPLPPRDRATPVTIAGTVASPLQPAHTIFNHQPAPGQGTRTVMGAPHVGAPPVGALPMGPPLERPVYIRPPQTGQERGNWPAARATEAPHPAPSAPHPVMPAETRSFGGSGGGRSAPPPAPSHPAPPPAATSHSSSPPASGHPK